MVFLMSRSFVSTPSSKAQAGRSPGSRAGSQDSAPRTRTEALRLQLADEIVSGVLEPGLPLDDIVRALEIAIDTALTTEISTPLVGGALD